MPTGNRLGCIHRFHRGARIVAIELGLGVQQQVGLAARPAWRRIKTTCRGHRLGQISTDAVGRLAEKSEPCAQQRRQFLREQLQLRRLRMLRGQIAEKYAGMLARDEAGGDVLRDLADRDRGQRRRRRLLLRFGHRFHDLRQHHRQFLRRHDRLVRRIHQQIVIRGMDEIELLPALGGLAQAVGDERVVLAQERADDEHAVEAAAAFRPRRTQPLWSAEKSDWRRKSTFPLPAP